MLRIAYVSRVKHDFGETDLDKIMLQSTANNKTDNVTGMLIYHDQLVFQVLEGPEANVHACYERISRDPRHWSLEKVYWRSIGSRAFTDWSMGLATPSQFRRSPGIALHSFTEIIKRLEAVSDLDISFGKRRLVTTMRDFMGRAGLNTPA